LGHLYRESVARRRLRAQLHAFVMDQPMAELVAQQTVALEQRYAVKVFSLNNWDDLFLWLDGIEGQGMTDEHKRGLEAADPGLRF
jgi:hypothetical protein